MTRPWQRFMADLCVPNPMYGTPLRYPGGKGRLTNYIREVMLLNGLDGGTYVEPFAGGAGIAINLLLDGTASRVVLNDADPSIFWFWKEVVEENERLADAVETCEVSVDEWRKQRAVQLRKGRAAPSELAFSTFYLNRMNRSGILDGGLIGGLRQAGAYSMDARFNRRELADRIRRIGESADRITLYCSDAAYFLASYLPQECDPEDTLIYADPPYYDKGSTLYLNHYCYEDHVELSSIFEDLDYRWVLSYDDVPEIREIYSWTAPVEFVMSHTANIAHAGRELFFAGRRTQLPDEDVVPSRKSTSAVRNPRFRREFPMGSCPAGCGRNVDRRCRKTSRFGDRCELDKKIGRGAGTQGALFGQTLNSV